MTYSIFSKSLKWPYWPKRDVKNTLYSTANVYGNADTTLVQVMRVVWRSVRTVCVPGVTIMGLITNQRLIAQEQIRKMSGLARLVGGGGGGAMV